MLRGRNIQRRSRGGEARLMRGKVFFFFFLQPNCELLLDVIYLLLNFYFVLKMIAYGILSFRVREC